MYIVLLQEFSESVNELKGQINGVQTAGKQLKESCSTQVKTHQHSAILLCSPVLCIERMYVDL